MVAARRVGGLAILVLSATSLYAQTRPSFLVQRGGIVAAVLPSSILGDAEVQRRLRSGLTTTFVLTVRPQRGAIQGGARLEIRFDLWDEFWMVRRIEFDGVENREQLTSRDALERWWKIPVRILGVPVQGATLMVTLSVLPFSPAEGEDTKQWVATAGAGAQGEGGSPLLAALLGTTLNARPIRSWTWQAEVTAR